MISFIDLAAQQARIRCEIEEGISRVLAHGQYILGPEVSELEEKLSRYVGVRNCITVANGTDALQVALMALDIGAGDEVIIPAFNYIAAAEAVLLVGAVPVFVDIEEYSFNISLASVEAAITSKTKAIIAVGLFGRCPDLIGLEGIARQCGVKLIEDAAQSFGATQGIKKSCSFGDMATTSFFPAKPLGCYGDGGAIFVSDDSLAEKARKIARHGQTTKYHHELVGMNSRLDTLQAAILLVKLSIFDEEVELRRQVAERYDSMIRSSPLLLEMGVVPPALPEGGRSVWAQYTMLVEDRDRLCKELKIAGIPTAVYYPTPLSRQPALESAHTATDVTVSEAVCSKVLSLPMHPYLSAESQEHIVDTLSLVMARISFHKSRVDSTLSNQ